MKVWEWFADVKWWQWLMSAYGLFIFVLLYLIHNAPMMPDDYDTDVKKDDDSKE